MKLSCVLLTFAILIGSYSDGAKILGIFHMASPSHYILGSALMRGLAEKGHDVTIVSPYDEKEPLKGIKYRNIPLTGIDKALKEKLKPEEMFKMFERSSLFLAFFLGSFGLQFTKDALKHENFQNLLKSNETFDLIILENFQNHAHRALALHYKTPLISFSTIGANSWTNNLVANPAPISYIPEMITFFPVKMNFWQRLVNTFVYLINEFVDQFYFQPKHKQIVKEYFPDIDDVDQIDHNVDLILLNSHPSISQPVPHVPNMIEIGGFHIKPPKKLPKDLQNFLDSAKDGFIYFSMGSNLKSSALPIERRNAILNVFKKLKLKILWKWEEDNLPGQPENVKLIKWAPQQDILAHPNIKLFITHGGLLSSTETIYHGVPILAIPVMADQITNALSAFNNGYALVLPFFQFNEKDFNDKLNELLTNPKYGEVAKKRSAIFHDRESKPLDTAIFWVEYILRHGSGKHLMVDGINLPWYKYYLLDVIAFIIFIIFILLKVFCFILRCVFKGKKGKQDPNKLKVN